MLPAYIFNSRYFLNKNSMTLQGKHTEGNYLEQISLSASLFHHHGESFKTTSLLFLPLPDYSIKKATRLHDISLNWQADLSNPISNSNNVVSVSRWGSSSSSEWQDKNLLNFQQDFTLRNIISTEILVAVHNGRCRSQVQRPTASIWKWHTTEMSVLKEQEMKRNWFSIITEGVETPCKFIACRNKLFQDLC